MGDGGYVLQLERRGYVKAGNWTPEAAVEHPEAGANILALSSNDPESVLSSVALFDLLRASLLSATAAQGVPEGWSRRPADIHLLLQRGQAGDQQQCEEHHRQWGFFCLHMLFL